MSDKKLYALKFIDKNTQILVEKVVLIVAENFYHALDKFNDANQGSKCEIIELTIRESDLIV